MNKVLNLIARHAHVIIAAAMLAPAASGAVFAQAIPPWTEVQPHLPHNRAAILYRERPRLVELRDRVVRLEAAGRDRHEYSMAKTQCWMRMANESHHENDRSAAVDEALDEAQALVESMEASRGAPERPIIGSSHRLREDLWGRVAKGKQHPRWSECAPALMACLEVQLQWSGHEARETGWRHAKPYVEIAEDMADALDEKLAACTVPATPAPAVSQPPPIPAPTPVVPPVKPVTEPVRYSLAADALFRFDRSGPNDVLPGGRMRLDEVAAMIRARSGVERIRIIGHADRLGKPDYNRALAQRRAETVKGHLVQRGVPAEIVETSSEGSSSPVTAGCRNVRDARQLIECLGPDRRVDIEIFGRSSP